MFDFGYFVRTLSLFWRNKGKTKNLLDEVIVKGRCWTNDLDLNWHMNNSRYLRECDFGRVSLLIETGLWDVLLERRKNGMKDANIIVSALQVQYRQSVELGDTFEIRTRINGWDDKAFYLEQSMILDKNKQIVFLMLIRYALTPRSLTPQMLVDDLKIASIESPILSPAMQILKDNYRLNCESIRSKI
jgi:YbgC/YbaW family acyl-CoA thioester hydrolase